MLHLGKEKKIEKTNDPIRQRLGHANSLWWERYRPQTVDDMCLPEELKGAFNQLKDIGIPSNLLFVGNTGTGKTTLMKILAKNHANIFLNASLERGIDTIRKKIKDFGSVSVSSTKSKLICLDEIDQLSKDSQLALRGTIESIAKTTRFIGTCNYPEKLDKAIISRFQVIDFDFSGNARAEVMIQTAKRINMICSDNNLKITTEALQLVLQKWTDMRSIIDCLQMVHDFNKPSDNTIRIEHINSANQSQWVNFFEVMTNDGDLLQIRKWINQNFPKQELTLIDILGDTFVEWISNNKPDLMKNAHVIYALAHKYAFESKNVSDRLTSLMALIAEIRSVI